MQSATINGQTFTYHKSGAGKYAVILETGLGAESDEWGSVEQLLTGSVRVFRYDRLGRGGSGAAKDARATDDMVADLRELLTVTQTVGPYVIVGHSFGGFIARAFAASFPLDTVGMVLIESIHRTQFLAIGPLFPAPRADDPPALQSMRAFWQDGWRDPEKTAERIDFERCFRVEASLATLGAMPVLVITSDSFLMLPFIPSAIKGKMQEQWRTLQNDFLSLSSRSSQIIARGAGHFVQRDDPDLIGDCVLSLIRTHTL